MNLTFQVWKSEKSIFDQKVFFFAKSPFSLYLKGLSTPHRPKKRNLAISEKQKSWLFIGNMCIFVIFTLLIRKPKYAFRTRISTVFALQRHRCCCWPLRGKGQQVLEILVFLKNTKIWKNDKNENVSATAATARFFYNDNGRKSPVQPGLQREREFWKKVRTSAAKMPATRKFLQQ